MNFLKQQYDIEKKNLVEKIEEEDEEEEDFIIPYSNEDEDTYASLYK